MGWLSKVGAVVGGGMALPMLGMGLDAVSNFASAKQAANAQKDANRINTELANKENIFNADEALKGRDFSAAQAKTQMDYQERMSNSSYQRATADMRAAGINPMLAVDQGGASTPSGSMASSPTSSGTHATVMPVPPTIPNVASSARDMINLYTSFKSSMAQTKLADEQASKTHADTYKSYADTAKTGTETDLLKLRMNESKVDSRIFDWFDNALGRISDYSAKSFGPKSDWIWNQKPAFNSTVDNYRK